MSQSTLSYAATAVLQSIARGYRHGFDVSRATGLPSGTVYPALRRLEDNGWVTSEWVLSENNRRARFYTITRAGRTHLRAEASVWFRYAGAVTQVLRSAPSIA